MKIKRMAAIAAAALTIMVLAGCGKSTSAAADKSQVKIGILQLIDQQALTAARKGFTEELAKAGYKGKKIKLDYVNAQGDQSNLQTMSQRLQRDKTISTWRLLHRLPKPYRRQTARPHCCSRRSRIQKRLVL